MNVSYFDKLVEAIITRIKKETSIKKSIICTVETPPPNITLKYGELIIPTSMIKVNNILLENYHRKYKLDGIIDEEEQDVSEFSFTYDDSSMTEGPGPHTHNLITSSGTGNIKSTGAYKHHGDIWFIDTLQFGNEVVVEIIDNSYVVMAHVVQMPSQAKEGA